MIDEITWDNFRDIYREDSEGISHYIDSFYKVIINGEIIMISDFHSCMVFIDNYRNFGKEKKEK